MAEALGKLSRISSYDTPAYFRMHCAERVRVFEKVAGDQIRAGHPAEVDHVRFPDVDDEDRSLRHILARHTALHEHSLRDVARDVTVVIGIGLLESSAQLLEVALGHHARNEEHRKRVAKVL